MKSYGVKFARMSCIIVVYVVDNVVDMLELVDTVGLQKFPWISVLLFVWNDRHEWNELEQCLNLKQTNKQTQNNTTHWEI